ncbi:MAG: hypothetical protein FWF84_00310 [Kiritimatiellaeota bacterium]|nr:hypothetical protein [Kiritimatiellota bacterium]
MWSWPETVHVTLESFRTVLTLLEEFPEFHFSQSQASVYAIVQEFDAAMLERIKKQVKAGRWEVTASHWVENDANMAGAEALVQHLMQTRAYMKELFGLSPEDVPIDWAPDTFGFAATTPSYLSQGGVKYVYMHRPGHTHQPVPEAFRWQGPDGGEVLVHNAQKRGYNCVIEPYEMMRVVESMKKDTGLDFGVAVYGVGDHGGGPTRRDLLMLREMLSWPIFPKLTPSKVVDFYKRLDKERGKLKVIRDELNVEFTGCYTSQSLIKRDNRIGEARMAELGAAFAMARGAGCAIPGTKAAYDAAWRKVLFSHFHDILPGSGVQDTRLYCHGEFQHTMAYSSAMLIQALRGVAEKVNTAKLSKGEAKFDAEVPALYVSDGVGSGAGINAAEGTIGMPAGMGTQKDFPFVVFNLTGHERTEMVDFTLWERDHGETRQDFIGRQFAATLADGTGVEACCVEAPERWGAWGHLFKRMRLLLTVPAFGFTTVVFREKTGKEAPSTKDKVTSLSRKHHCSYSVTERPVLGMENTALRATFDTVSGELVSLIDKSTGVDLLADSDGVGPEMMMERPVNMSAWITGAEGKRLPMELKKVEQRPFGDTSFELVFTYAMGRSNMTATYRLDAGSATLKAALAIDWLERGNDDVGVPNLRYRVSTALVGKTALHEIPFGAIERTTTALHDVPSLRWTFLSSQDSPTGLLVTNDSKYGSVTNDGTLTVNLLRSSYNPDPLPELGAHRCAFTLTPVKKTGNVSALIRMAQAEENPLIPVGTNAHAGSLAPETGMLSITGAGVVLSCATFAESNDTEIIVRLVNTTPKAAPATVTLDKAFGRIKKASLADLLERPTTALPVKGHGVALTVPASGIASLRLTLG